MRKRTYRIKIKGGYFVDDVRESPVDERQAKFRRTALIILTVSAGLLVALCFAFRS